jgi:hypothetical protein
VLFAPGGSGSLSGRLDSAGIDIDLWIIYIDFHVNYR